MIHTRINRTLGVVFNESTGSFSHEDVVHALVRTEELGHGRCAVVWDLRRTDADQFSQKFGALLKDTLNSKVIVPSSHCRAIVARNTASREQLEGLIRELPVPWRWIVTTSLGEAVAWVVHHHQPDRE